MINALNAFLTNQNGTTLALLASSLAFQEDPNNFISQPIIHSVGSIAQEIENQALGSPEVNSACRELYLVPHQCPYGNRGDSIPLIF